MIHRHLRVTRILNWIHLNLIVIPTLICPHPLMTVLQVMTGVRKERGLIKETSINVQKGGIKDETKSVDGVIRDLRSDQEGIMLNLPWFRILMACTSFIDVISLSIFVCAHA